MLNPRPALSDAALDESNLWMPPRRLVRYQLAKSFVALLAILIFTGWLVLQWSNPVMRILAMALLTMTVWITVGSIITDMKRARGRQIALENGNAPDEAVLAVTIDLTTRRVPLQHVDHAVWRDDELEKAGLWLFGHDENLLVHLDLDFLADESEARTFLGWVRQHAPTPFEVKWPDRV